MDLILANSNFEDIAFIIDFAADIEIGNSDNSFDITIPASDYNNNFKPGNVLYIPNSEFGGIIGEIKTESSSQIIHLIGYTWRGMLKYKLIAPDTNSSDKSVSGEVADVLTQIIGNKFGSRIIVNNEPTGVNLSDYKIIGYSTILEAINLMLSSVGMKLKISYKQEAGADSYVELAAVPISDYSQEIELSSDYQLNFSFDSVVNGVNHLVVVNPETSNKLDLYADSNGKIVETPFYSGIDEIEEKFESSESDEEAFRQAGIDRLKEVMNKKNFSMNVETLNLDIDIGDIIGGRDYITGFEIAKPIISKVLKIENGNTTLEYEIEGEES